MPLQPRLSRRAFTALALGAPLLVPRPTAAARITAGDVLMRLRSALGPAWREGAVDGIAAGSSSTAVTGIATTALASLAVLKQAVAAGANVVVTLEPPFYAARQEVPDTGADAVLAAKQAFIAAHTIVIIRLRDSWRAYRPDPMAEGLGDALGWRAHRAGADPMRYDLPPAPLDALVRHVQRSLGTRGGLRVVGRPEATVRRVALLPGATPLAAMLDVLPRADVVVAGEVREWESVEYARDAIHAGAASGLVLVGRVVSEEPGMRACAAWLAGVVPDVPVRHLGAGDPYWRP